jgi:hypothetical protein
VLAEHETGGRDTQNADDYGQDAGNRRLKRKLRTRRDGADESYLEWGHCPYILDTESPVSKYEYVQGASGLCSSPRGLSWVKHSRGDHRVCDRATGVVMVSPNVRKV